MLSPPRTWFSIAALAALVSAGCTDRYLTATPNLLCAQDPGVVYSNCPEACRRPDMSVIYATDRAPLEPSGKPDKSAKLAYGSGRSSTLVFGSAIVDLTPKLGWTDLVNDSTVADRKNTYALRLGDCREAGKLEMIASRQPLGVSGLQLTGAVEDNNEYEKRLQDLLKPRLAASPSKDVFIYVHGVNNSFEDSIFRVAELWHFLGRVGVPISYSWPAGNRGLINYAYDRESGEFTVTHLKQFLKAVASCPDVERVHLIAHSRGADVAITALRELHIGYRSQGLNTRDVLKLENLVLAAPDLDEDVFVQRFIAEDLLSAANRTTIYASGRDQALEVADVIFGSKKRVGSLVPRDLSPKVRQALTRLPQLQFIECKAPRFSSYNHDYIFSDPAALSDLILVVRDRRPPGAQNGRPLLQPVEGVWELTNDYPTLKK
jgi:esterase/lipase superfamily enzyme